jgi:hypothetical protein
LGILGRGDKNMEFNDETISLLKEKAQSILKTLPIAHYFKISTLTVVFDEFSTTSYIDLSTLQINVAFNNLLLALRNIDTKDVNDLTVEKIIRGCLYHELSHAILTPKGLFSVYKDLKEYYPFLSHDLINILEDERIERVFENYYINVDFQENIILMNGDVECSPSNFTNFVFSIVRMHKFPKGFDKAVKETFIKQMKFVVGKPNLSEYDLLSIYNEIIENLKNEWDRLTPPEPEKSETPESSSSDSEGELEGECEGECECDSDSESESENETDSEIDSNSKKETEGEIKDDSEPSKPTECTERTDIEYDKEKAIESIEASILRIKQRLDSGGVRKLKLDDFYPSKNFKREATKIIIRKKGIGIEETTSSYGYTGRLSPKKMLRDESHNEETYKWFRKNFEGDAYDKRDDKKILNIWLDQSGSFSTNDEGISIILKSLQEIEKKYNFHFNLIKLTCDCNLITDDDKRFSHSYSGNALPVKKIAKVYKQVNPTGNEFNIVLFDGYAMSLDFMDESWLGDEIYDFKALKVFNNKKTFFITEKSNIEGIMKNCPSCRGIINENRRYKEALEKNVLNALDLLF